jgi:hypothetical protein
MACSSVGTTAHPTSLAQASAFAASAAERAAAAAASSTDPNAPYDPVNNPNGTMYNPRTGESDLKYTVPSQVQSAKFK